MNTLFRAKFFLPLIAFLFICFSPLAQAGNLSTPDTTVAEFYKWYIHSVMTEHYPMEDDRAKLATYVSKALINEINHGAGEDADYFTKSQDDFPDWEQSIAIKETKIKGATATVIVTIGATKESFEKLTVTLKKDGQTWKIRSVRADSGATLK